MATAAATARPSPGADPADEAGGEVVYSSDGLAPVLPVKPPAVAAVVGAAAVAGGADGEEAVLDSEQMSPQTAFEVFRGKVYSVAVPPGRAAPSSGGGNNNSESTLERLARLEREVSALEADLKATAAFPADGGRDFDEQLVRLAADLKSRLGVASSARVSDQDELTRMIRKQVEQVQRGGGGRGEAESAAKASAGGGGAGAPTSTGLVYELYGNAAGPTTALEERLLTLERLLGSPQPRPSPPLLGGSGPSAAASSPAGQGPGAAGSLLRRLEEMESLVSAVDSATLEQAATKAKVIRADLEAASKARNKLTATYKKEDSKMIQQLYQQMVDLEGLSSYLPSLVERLQQLSSLHLQASTYGRRLEELERGAVQLESSVSQLELGMGQMQEALVQNIQTMEANLQKLDETLKEL